MLPAEVGAIMKDFEEALRELGKAQFEPDGEAVKAAQKAEEFLFFAFEKVGPLKGKPFQDKDVAKEITSLLLGALEAIGYYFDRAEMLFEPALGPTALIVRAGLDVLIDNLANLPEAEECGLKEEFDMLMEESVSGLDERLEGWKMGPVDQWDPPYSASFLENWLIPLEQKKWPSTDSGNETASAGCSRTSSSDETDSISDSLSERSLSPPLVRSLKAEDYNKRNFLANRSPYQCSSDLYEEPLVKERKRMYFFP